MMGAWCLTATGQPNWAARVITLYAPCYRLAKRRGSTKSSRRFESLGSTEYLIESLHNGQKGSQCKYY